MEEWRKEIVRRWQNGELANDSPEVVEELKRQVEEVNRIGDDEEWMEFAEYFG